MKKSIFIILSIFFIHLTSHAQVYIGAAAGVAITNLKTNGKFNFDYSSLTGFNLKIPVLYKVNKNISFESGISYINMGSTLSFHAEGIDENDPIYQALIQTKYYYRLNYLSLPLTCNVSISFNKYAVYAKAGGYFSYLLNATLTNSTDDNKEKSDLKEDDTKMNRADAGVLFGLGANRELGPGLLFIDMHYMIGCVNLNTYDNYNFIANVDPFNRGLLINAGYVFRLGKS